jgi:hypothetical protein
MGESERSSAWLERVVWVHEVAGSNPVAPTIFFPPPDYKILYSLFTDLFTVSAMVKISSHGQKGTENQFPEIVPLFSTH